MDQSLLDALRRMYSAEDVSAGLAVLEEVADPQIELRPTGRFVDIASAEHVRGPEGVGSFFEAIGHAFGRVRYELKALEVQGDAVIADVVFIGEGLSSGITVEDRIWHVHHVRAGKIVLIEVFTSEREAKEGLTNE